MSALSTARVDLRDHFIELGALNTVKECLRLGRTAGHDTGELIDTATAVLEVLSSAPPLTTVSTASLLSGTVSQLAHFSLPLTSRPNDEPFINIFLDASLRIKCLQLFTRSRFVGVGRSASVQLASVGAQDALLSPGVSPSAWKSHRLWRTEEAIVHQFGVVFDERSHMIAEVQVRVVSFMILHALC